VEVDWTLWDSLNGMMRRGDGLLCVFATVRETRMRWMGVGRSGDDAGFRLCDRISNSLPTTTFRYSASNRSRKKTHRSTLSVRLSGTRI